MNDSPIMRRCKDDWVNATQILKCCNFPKAKRTKILEKGVQQGVHEKIQGGFGRFQGTWIPLEDARRLAATYGVTKELAPVLFLDFSDPNLVIPFKAKPPPKDPNDTVKRKYVKKPKLPGDTPRKYKTGKKAALQAAQEAAQEAAQGAAQGAAQESNAISGMSTGKLINVNGNAHLNPNLSHDSSQAITNGQYSQQSILGVQSMQNMQNAMNVSGMSNMPNVPNMPNMQNMPMMHSMTHNGALAVMSTSFQPNFDEKFSRTEAYPIANVPNYPPPQLMPRFNSMPVNTSAPGAAYPLMASNITSQQQHQQPDQNIYHSAKLSSSQSSNDTNWSISQDQKDSDTSINSSQGDRKFLVQNQPQHNHHHGQGQSEGQVQNQGKTHAQTHAQNQYVAADSSPSEDGNSYSSQLLRFFSEDNLEIPLFVRYPPADFNMNAPIDDEGHTPLHWAASIGHQEMIHTLISNNANPLVVNNFGLNPLSKLISFNNCYELKNFDQILNDLELCLINTDINGRTPLHYLCQYSKVRSKLDSLKLYMKSILAKLTVMSSQTMSKSVNLMKNVLNHQDIRGDTCLHIAVKSGCIPIIVMLLRHGAQDNIENVNGETVRGLINGLPQKDLIFNELFNDESYNFWDNMVGKHQSQHQLHQQLPQQLNMQQPQLSDIRQLALATPVQPKIIKANTPDTERTTVQVDDAEDDDIARVDQQRLDALNDNKENIFNDKLNDKVYDDGAYDVLTPIYRLQQHHQQQHQQPHQQQQQQQHQHNSNNNINNNGNVFSSRPLAVISESGTSLESVTNNNNTTNNNNHTSPGNVNANGVINSHLSQQLLESLSGHALKQLQSSLKSVVHARRVKQLRMPKIPKVSDEGQLEEKQDEALEAKRVLPFEDLTKMVTGMIGSYSLSYSKESSILDKELITLKEELSVKRDEDNKNMRYVKSLLQTSGMEDVPLKTAEEAIQLVTKASEEYRNRIMDKESKLLCILQRNQAFQLANLVQQEEAAMLEQQQKQDVNTDSIHADPNDVQVQDQDQDQDQVQGHNQQIDNKESGKDESMIGGTEDLALEEKFELAIELTRLQHKRNKLVAKIVDCTKHYGVDDKMYKYRKLLSLSCGVRVEDIDSLIDGIAESLEETAN